MKKYLCIAALFGVVACTTIQLIAATITLSWTDNSTNETGFKIEKSIDGAPFLEIGQTLADQKEFIDNGPFLSGVEYAYRVRAFNQAGNSGYSNTASVVWPSIPNAPSAVIIRIQ